MSTIESVAKYIGRPIKELRADKQFKAWPAKKSVQEDDLDEGVETEIFYTFNKHGMEVICDAQDVITTIFMHAKKFDADIVGLPFASTQKEVRKHFGKPAKSGKKESDPLFGDIAPWDRFKRKGYVLHIEYQLDDDSIQKITAMANHVAP